MGRFTYFEKYIEGQKGVNDDDENNIKSIRRNSLKLKELHPRILYYSIPKKTKNTK